MLDFGKYLVFVDEAGDHVLEMKNPEFPVFVLAFCIFEKEYYCNTVLPAFNTLKLNYFKDLNVIFHERDIRKAQKNFEFLTNAETRTAFMNDLTAFIENIKFTVIATAIKKDLLKKQYTDPENPYHLAVEFCLERLRLFLLENNNLKPTTVSFEARGQKEDEKLKLAFLEKVNHKDYCGNLDIAIIDKKSNCAGLQIADLIARPIGRHIINPSQENRAFDIIKTKFRKNNSNGIYTGYGLKIFP